MPSALEEMLVTWPKIMDGRLEKLELGDRGDYVAGQRKEIQCLPFCCLSRTHCACHSLSLDVHVPGASETST